MLFRKNIDPRCAYCAKARVISDAQMACIRKGIVPVESHCGAFEYDPLKRVPPRPVKLNTAALSESDFEE